MKIRQKRMVLLLVVSLVPAIVIALLYSRLMLVTGTELAEQRREALIEDGRFFLRSLVDSYGQIIVRDRLTIENAIERQVREVEHCLSINSGVPGTSYFNADYEDQARGPAALTTLDKYNRAVDGLEAPIPVTFDHQVFVLQGGVTRQETASDVNRLLPMTAVYRELHDDSPGLVQWLYTCLETGLHSSYPGHGGYPAEFDARQRPWYRQAVESGQMTWTILSDVSTGKVNLSGSHVVRRPGGDIAGVCGIDVRMAGVLETIQLPDAWQGEAIVLQVQPNPQESSIDRTFLIVAQEKYIASGESWDENLEWQYLNSSDADELFAMGIDVAAGTSGVRRMAFDGRDMFWAYNAWEDGALLQVVIIPYDLVVARALAAQVYIEEEIKGGLRVAGGVLLIVLIIAILVAIRNSRSLTRPIRQLARAANALATGNFNSRVSIETGDELQDLGEAFNEMGSRLEEHQRMKQALAVATEIQQHLLPHDSPQLERFDIAGRSVACDETGGDYFDFVEVVELAPGKMGVAVGDVTGHGIGAGLLMATARSALRNLAVVYGEDLDRLFETLNRSLHRDTGSARFVTLFYGLLCTETGELRWVSAGHDPPLRLRKISGEFELLTEGGGIPLGALPQASYSQAGPLTLEPGDLLMVGTDGIWEAENREGEQFGMDRVRQTLLANQTADAADICNVMIDDVTRFRDGAPQTDDITLVIIRVR
jgi:phosphoserine phosphatase RsbU/P